VVIVLNFLNKNKNKNNRPQILATYYRFVSMKIVDSLRFFKKSERGRYFSDYEMIFKIEIEAYFKIQYPLSNNNGILPTQPFFFTGKIN